jgi:hypothetical protein
MLRLMLGGAVLLSALVGHTTFGRTALDEWSARRRELYLTTHNTRQRQTTKPPVGFESTIPATKRLHIHALEPAVTGIGAISCSSAACFNLPLSPERFNYSTSTLRVPLTFSSINWSVPEHEQSIYCKAILLLPILLVICLILHLKGNGIKLIRIVVTGLKAGFNFWQESSYSSRPHP